MDIKEIIQSIKDCGDLSFSQEEAKAMEEKFIINFNKEYKIVEIDNKEESEEVENNLEPELVEAMNNISQIKAFDGTPNWLNGQVVGAFKYKKEDTSGLLALLEDGSIAIGYSKIKGRDLDKFSFTKLSDAMIKKIDSIPKYTIKK